MIGEKARPKLATTEAELSKVVCDIAHDLGWRVFRLPIAKGKRPVKDATGYPDLTVARNRRVMWVELKMSANSMEPLQLAWARDLPDVVLVTERWTREDLGRLFA